MADYVAGFVYGLASTMVGQPFDTIKTRMQAMEQIKSKGVYETGKEIFIKEGIRGLYRGGLPMILGGGALRSAQFGVNNSVLELIKRNNLVDSDYKHFGFLRLNVVLAGFCGGLARGFVETPIEFMKVRRQVEKKWEWREVTGGSGVTLFRNSILFTSFVIYVDLSKQVFPNGLSPFMTGALCSSLAWTTVWPFDVVKSRVQSGRFEGKSVVQVLREVVKDGHLYRGIAPGLVRSAIANGCGMVAYNSTLKFMKNM